MTLVRVGLVLLLAAAFASVQGSGSAGCDRVALPAEIPAPLPQSGAIIGPDNASRVAASRKHLWIAGELTVYRADPVRRQVTKRLPLAVIGLTLADMWIDPSTGRFTPTQLASEPHGVTYGAGYVWVAMYHQSTIRRADPRTGRLLGRPIRTSFPTEPLAAAGDSLWAIPSPGAPWRTRGGTRFCGSTFAAAGCGRPSGRGGRPRAIVASGDGAWVATTRPDELVRFGG